MFVLRGLACGDMDHDGDLDIVISQNEGAPLLLKNTSSPQNARIILQFQAGRSNRAAIGTQVRWPHDGVEFFAEVRTASSYLSSSALEIAIGCAGHNEISDVAVRWPSGFRTPLPKLKVNHRFLVQESGETKDLGALVDR